jgi:N-acetylmuramoyl-L-alanine amidase
MRVVIDPGHGGTANEGDSSWNNAVGPTGLLEKSVTLEVALFAQIHLGGLGIECTLTRQTDVNLGLVRRAAVAKDLDADAFVSIHFNASDAHNAQGTETWIHPRASAASRSLAAAVQAGMVAATGYRDRGVKTANFGVVNPDNHAARTGACLVECSFMDIRAEESRLRDAVYKDRLAKALAQSIHGWLIASGRIAPEGAAALEVTGEASFPEDGYELETARTGLPGGDPGAALPECCSEALRFDASDDLSIGEKVPNAGEVATCGAIARKIRRTDSEFAQLVKNQNPKIVFKDEEQTAADRMMSPRLKEKLDLLADKVAAEWTGVKLRVTEAWDENDEHAGSSLHYEGRSADLTTFPLDAAKYGRLGRLAVDSGCDWVFYENAAHIHVSVKR